MASNAVGVQVLTSGLERLDGTSRRKPRLRGELLDAWRRSLERREYPARTIALYRQRLAKFERWCLETGIDVEHVTGADIVRWLDGLNVSSRTRYAYTSTVATFYAWATREGYVRTDPTATVDRPRFRQDPIASVTPIGDDWELVEAWCKWLRRRNRAASTQAEYRRMMARFARWLADEGLTLATATHRHINDWLDSSETGPSAQYAYTSKLATFYGWAVREEYLEYDPTLRVDRPAIPHRIPRPAPTVAIRHALEVSDPRVAAMVALGTFAGLRRAEIARLRGEDVLVDRPTPVVLVHGKGGRDRLVPLHPEVLHRLREYGLPAQGWLFPSPALRGRPLSPGHVGKLLAAALSNDLARLTAHPLRHWFASESYRLSKDIRLVQELLGHANVQTTAAYTAWSPDDAVAVIGLLDVQ